MKTLRGVLFDLDGTLFITEELHHWAIRKAYKKQTGKNLPLALLRPFIGLPYRDRLAAVFELQGIKNPKLLEKIAQQAVMFFEGRFLPYEIFVPGTRRLLRALRRRHVRVGIVSSAAHDRIQENLYRATIAPFFQVIIGRDDVPEHKPHPAPYLAGRAALGVPDEEILVFEDSPAGVASAVGAGLRVIALTTSCTTLPNATFVLPDYELLTIPTLELLLQ